MPAHTKKGFSAPARSKGFTLVELLVVIAIIAILSVVGVVVFTNVQNSARDVQKRADINAMNKTMEVINSNEGVYRVLTASDFASGSVPRPPEGGDYYQGVAADGSGYQICASQEKGFCNLFSSPTCTCLGSPITPGVTVAGPGVADLGTESFPAASCKDILITRGGSNGVYKIKPPGVSNAFNVYCDMTTDGGGWMLLDNFVSSLPGDSDPYGAAIGKSNIKNSSDLTNAGYTVYLTNFEDTTYTRKNGYLQMFYSSGPFGYIQKTLPPYANEVYVKWGNWYGGTATLTIGTTDVQTIGGIGDTTYQGSYTLGNVIKFSENGIFYAGEIWVR